MPLYNVDVALKCTMVVQAEDEDHAQDVACDNYREALNDCDARPSLHVTGDVTQERHLRDGWDGQCIPYGGEGNTKISALLHNAKVSGAGTASAGLPGYAAGGNGERK